MTSLSHCAQPESRSFSRQILTALLALLAAAAALALRREPAEPHVAPAAAVAPPAAASSSAPRGAVIAAPTPARQPAAASVRGPDASRAASAVKHSGRARVRPPEPAGDDLLEDAASAGMTSRSQTATSGTPR